MKDPYVKFLTKMTTSKKKVVKFLVTAQKFPKTPQKNFSRKKHVKKHQKRLSVWVFGQKHAQKTPKTPKNPTRSLVKDQATV